MKSIVILLGILGLISFYAIATDQYNIGVEPMISPLPAISPTPTPTMTPTPIPTITPTPTPAGKWVGKASWYGENGCLGCSATLTTASGERLDDSKLTLAVTPEMMRQYNLMKKNVLVTNTNNQKSVIAKINDTGGFSKYNRIADLGYATKTAIECGDVCNVEISVVK